MIAVNKCARAGRTLLKYILLGSAAALLPVGSAHAQTAGESDAAENDHNIIIVTATKREQSLQDVPLSVTALSVDALDNAAVTNIESLQFSVPGLSMTTSSGTGFQSSIRIRGVGTSGTNLGFEGSVGIFVDGIYRPRAGSSLGDFADVERIEVLRGPQGTLFGRNTTAGAISVVTKKPEFNDFSASFRATVGNYGRVQVRGIANAPLADDTLAARIAVDYNKRDGFLENLVPGVGDINDRDRLNIRSQFLFEPTPEMQFRLIGSYFYADESCCGAVVFNNGPGGGFIAPGNAGLLPGITPPVAPDASQREDFLTARDRPTREKQEEFGVQFDFEWDLSDSVTWFNSLSYTDFETRGSQDSDQTGIDFTFTDPNTVTTSLLSFESRFSGELEAASIAQSINWILGVYYSDEDLGQIYGLNFGTDADIINALLVGGGAPGFPPLGFSTGDNHLAFMGQDAQTYAAFGHLDIDFNDQLNLSGGLRYTKEEKTGTGDFTSVNLGPFNPFILPGAKNFVADADANELTGTAALKYSFTDNVSIYASYAHGYKSGGVNLDVLGGQAGALAGTPRALVANGFMSFNETFGDPTFPVETVDTYELGFRSQFWDNRGTFNVTGFHSTFKNFQVLQFTGTSFNVLAAPEVTTKGFETELRLNPVEGLDIGAQYTYADAAYTEPFLLGGNQLDGQTINNAPKHSGSVNATYSTSLGSNFKGFVNGGWYFNSSYNASAALESTRIQKSYSLFTGRVGISTEDDRFGLELWCRNCGNQAVNQIIFSSPIVDGSEFAYIHPPREWGLTASMRF